MSDGLPGLAKGISNNVVSRRSLLAGIPLTAAATAASYKRALATAPPATQPAASDHDSQPWFPSQNPDRVREMVGVAHHNLQRVRELLAASPALAKATWDWGFGDWEMALGAASHTGQREIAAALMEHGARPDLFTFAMLGQLESLQACIAANPGIQRTHGPHGITLLKHAQAGGPQAAATTAYLEQLGDADQGYAPLPMTESEQRVYVGVYVFGPGADDVVDVRSARDGLLTIKRGAQGTPRNLFHLGEHTFHPAGAAAVRLRFVVSGDQAESLRVFDPDIILEARARPASGP